MDLTLFISPEHRQDENFTKCFAEHVEQVRVARDAGFDGVAIGNHLSYSASAWFPPIETLMGLAAAAEGMRLSTCMLVLPMYHPLHVAQQAALLDIVTGGRFTLGVAQGWQADENVWVDAAATCEPAADYSRDVAANTISVAICQPGRYALFGATNQLLIPIIVQDEAP